MARRRPRWNRGCIDLGDGEEIKWDSPYQVWRAKKILEPISHKRLTVKCQGKMHTIEVRFPGRFTLLNHRKAEDRLMVKLGGDVPECVTFLTNWKDNPEWVCQNRPKLRPFLKARWDWNAHRRTWGGADYFNSTLQDRLRVWVDYIYASLLTKIGQKEEIPTYWDQTRCRYMSISQGADFIQPKVRISGVAVTGQERKED